MVDARRDENEQCSFGGYLKERRQGIYPEATSLGSHARIPSRLGKAITQEELAEAVGVSRTWYALLEAGTVGASPALLGRLSDALSLQPDERLRFFRLGIPELGWDIPAIPEGIFDTAPSASPNDQRLSVPVASLDEIGPAARRFAAAREEFLTSGSERKNVPRPRILASWTRCRAAHVDPNRAAAPIAAMTEGNLAERREQNKRLLRTAKPVVSYLDDHLAQSGYAVALTDSTGCILELHGEADVRRHLARIDFVPGGGWSENAAGTNAIGTSIADGRPMQLMAAEHFCEGWQDLTCTAAPIRSSRTGEVIGALDITGGYRLVRPYLLGFVMRCALEIEEALAKT